MIYKPKDFLSQDLYKKLDDIIYQLEEFNEVNTVVSLFNLSDIDSNAWIGDFMSPNWNNTRLNNALRYIQKDPTIGNRILSENLDYGAIIISLNDLANNHSDRTQLIKKVKNILKD